MIILKSHFSKSMLDYGFKNLEGMAVLNQDQEGINNRIK